MSQTLFDLAGATDEGQEPVSDGKTRWMEALEKAGADPDRRTKDGKSVADPRPSR